MTCIDCGKPTTGIRCKTCHGAYEKRRAALQLQESDTALLTMVATERLNSARLAARLGVSRQQADARLRAARRRTALLSET